jgi:hypothetical protein
VIKVNQFNFTMSVGLLVFAFNSLAADVTSLRQKLNRYYKKQDSDLRIEQQIYRNRQNSLSPQRQQRLTTRLDRQRVEQQRLQRRQDRQIAPSSGPGFSAPGLQSGRPGRRRADNSTLQRFERRNRQQRLQFRNQRRSWR